MPTTYDDLHVGWSATYGPAEMEREPMVAFAEQFDPQPMHLDPEAARAKGYDDVFASGLYTIGTATRLFVEHFLNDSTNLAGLGIENLRWHAPVYPGDELYASHEVTEMRVSESDDSRGIVTRDIEIRRGDDTVVCSWTVSILMGR
ncbi:MaoC/PaaZ C-terminal domain-containing protein [Halosegnis longus]|uniref:Acyl dehydratase n=1 Tax=Halosegnis longus TaxID=2216012 RepID=A0AAJ4R811_9EURY|nr:MULTISPECIES: MaoC/PaaZ C-terminal domain-containing protein [Halobacteriales]RNJ25969.1 acyl dehydratase [Salella cibi]